MPRKVLVASADPSERRGLARPLLDAGFDVVTAPDLEAAATAVRTARIEVVCLSSGLVATERDLDRLRAADRFLPLGLAAPAADLARAAAVARAIDGFLVALPLTAPEATALAFERAASERALRAATSAATQSGHMGTSDLVAVARATKRALAQAEAFAELDAPVLVSGEPGSGKRSFARLIHERSQRSAGPLRWVDAALLEPTVLERELWAEPDGLFQQARGGTLVLGRLEAMPLAAQERLRLALGASDDVRLLALSALPARALLAAGRLHEPLGMRLALRLEVPPLRQRRDDIPVLAYHFLRQHAEQLARPVRRIGVEALRLLRGGDYPGNLSELSDLLARATAACARDVILPRDFQPLGSGAFVEGMARWSELAELPYGEARQQALRQFETAYVRLLLAATGGRRREAARRAGMDAANFRRLCHRLELEAPGPARGRAVARGADGEVPTDTNFFHPTGSRK